MLSLPTVSFLDELQEKSHAAYPEGGMIYTYIEAANQAHCRYPRGRAASPNLPQHELEGLGRFLQASQGDYVSQSVGTPFAIAAERLMEHLHNDVRFNEVACLVEDEDYGMEAKLKMARRSDNRFFELELWWSID